LPLSLIASSFRTTLLKKITFHKTSQHSLARQQIFFKAKRGLIFFKEKKPVGILYLTDRGFIRS